MIFRHLALVCKFQLTVIVLLFFHFLVSGQESESPSREISATKPQDKSDIQIQRLVCQARACQLKQNDPKLADSLLKNAISIAEMTYQQDVILNAYNDYMECMDMGSYDKDRLNIANKAQKICNTSKAKHLLWRTYYNVAAVYQSMYLFSQALDFSYKSFSVAEYLKNDTLKARSYLSIGNSLWKNKNSVEAFRNYLQALNIAENLSDYELLNDCYRILSTFYSNCKNVDKALDYKLRQGALIRKKLPLDSLKLMYNQFELEYINVTAQRNPNENSIRLLLDFAERHKEIQLKQYVLSIYRYYLINNDQFSKLKELYIDKYPSELSSLARSDAGMFFRVKALVSEYLHKTDSAFYFFSKAEAETELSSNKELKATFYLRYGQFLVRQRRNEQAIRMFKKSLELAQEGHNLNIAIKSTQQLETVFENLRNFELALQFAKQGQVLSDSLDQITKKDELLQMEIDNAAKQREEALLRIEQDVQLRHKIQYTAITILIVVIFLILMLLGSMKVPKWVIELLGFISFILLFEFIVLLTDHIIEDITHGEPWKVLVIKIILISILMPLHHWVEKKMIRYLINKKLIHVSKDSFRRFLKEMFRPERGDEE